MYGDKNEDSGARALFGALFHILKTTGCAVCNEFVIGTDADPTPSRLNLVIPPSVQENRIEREKTMNDAVRVG